MDTLWITSASLSSTTSSRASSTSTPPAKCQRPCSRTALSSHVSTALHHTFLSLSVSPSLSPPHGLSLSALMLRSAATSRDWRHGPTGNGLVSFSYGNCPPHCIRGGRRAEMFSVCSLRDSSIPPPSMSLGNGRPGPSSQHAQSRSFLFAQQI